MVVVRAHRSTLAEVEAEPVSLRSAEMDLPAMAEMAEHQSVARMGPARFRQHLLMLVAAEQELYLEGTAPILLSVAEVEEMVTLVVVVEIQFGAVAVVPPQAVLPEHLFMAAMAERPGLPAPHRAAVVAAMLPVQEGNVVFGPSNKRH